MTFLGSQGGNRSVWVLPLVIALFLNLLGSRFFLRWDLTAEREFTLSHATKKGLKGIEEIITVTVYFSRNLPPQLLPLRREVQDLLGEFQSYAGKELRVEQVDPDEDPALKERLRTIGIPALTANVVEKDKQEVRTIYLGIAVQYGEKLEVIPVVHSTSNLEYDLIASIRKVAEKETPVVGWYATEGVSDRQGERLDTLRRQLQKRYKLRDLSDEKGDWDLAQIRSVVLLVAQPPTQEISKKLKVYLDHGGKLLALVEPIEIGEGLEARPREGDFSTIFKDFGIEVEKKLVLDRVSAMASFRSGPVTYQVNYPYWPEVRDLDRTHPITSTLEAIVLPWTTPLKLVSTEERPVITIAKTSPYGVEEEITNETVLDPNLARQTVASGTGKALPLVAQSGNVLVVGSIRFLQDKVLELFPANGLFFENAVDSFSSGNELIGIRSRGTARRPLPEMRDGTRSLVKIANLIAAPLLLLIAGAVVYFVRKTRFQALRAAYGRVEARN